MAREMDFVDECYADKDLSLLKKLTLVIPTYNRNYYLSRCLWYHAHFPFGQIIVADSSPEEKKVVNRETVAKVREMFGSDILYLEYEPETEKYGGDIYRKWGDAVSHSNTRYTQICTDKEFLMPETLLKCILFCDGDDGYIGAMGVWYNLTSSESGLQNMNITPIDPGNISLIEDDNPLVRMNDVFMRPQISAKSLLLCLMRTDCLKKVHGHYISYNISDIRYGEIFLAYSGYLYGKVKCFKNNIHKIRDEIAIQRDRATRKAGYINSSESSTTRYPAISEYNILDDAKLFESIYRNAMINELINTVQIPKDRAIIYVQEMMASPLFGKQIGNKNLKSRASNYWNKYPLIGVCWRNLPLQVQHIANKFTIFVFKIPLPITSLPTLKIEKNPETNIINNLIIETIGDKDNDLPIK